MTCLCQSMVAPAEGDELYFKGYFICPSTILAVYCPAFHIALFFQAENSPLHLKYSPCFHAVL